MTEFSELIQSRRSIRDYKDKSVSNDLIKEIILQSCQAPNASHRQPWATAIVTDKAIMKRLSDESKKNVLAQMEGDESAEMAKYSAVLKDEKFNVFYNAPAMVYIGGQKDHYSLAVDCALLAAYFMLIAADKGLGTCWIGLGSNIQDSALRAEIGMTDDFEIVAPVIIGYPTTIPKSPERQAPNIIDGKNPFKSSMA